MPEKQIESGAIIYREGDVADMAYMVVSGKVELIEISDGREVQIGTVEKDRIFGELAMFDPQALRPHTARAMQATSLDSMAQDEFAALLAKCPEAIQPFLSIAFDKMKATKSKHKTPVATVLETDVKAITISPVGEKMKTLFKTMEVPIGRLPFRIGGFPEGGEASRRDQLHLYIASQINPLRVSRQHCEIIVEKKEILVSDLGSRFCTIVNGAIIGRGHGHYTTPLKKGLNEITLGAADGPYKLSVKCE